MKEIYEIMFKFILKILPGLLGIFSGGCFGESFVSDSKRRIKSFKKCYTLVNINTGKTLFYAFTVDFNKCSRSCNSIDDPYARIFFRS